MHKLFVESKKTIKINQWLNLQGYYSVGTKKTYLTLNSIKSKLKKKD